MLIRAWTVCAVFGAALAVASAGETPTASRVPEAGGVRIDMSLDGARKAIPGAVWRDLPSVHTSKTIAIAAYDAWTLEGQPYYLKLTPHRSGGATLLIDGRVDGIDTAACRTRTVALVAHLNTYFDDIKDRSTDLRDMLARPPIGGGRIVAQTPPGGSTPMVTGVPDAGTRQHDDEYKPPSRTELFAGRNARLSEKVAAAAKTTSGEGGFVTWAWGQPPTKEHPYSLEGDAAFLPADPFFEPKSRCRITAVVQAKPWGPAREDVLDPALKPRPLSPGTLHASLDGVEVPEEPVTLAFRCDVARASGKVSYCKAKDPAQDKLDVMRAARRRLAKMTFDGAFDPDNDVRLVADVTVTIAPGERLSDEAYEALPLAPRVSVATGMGPVILMQTVSPAELDRSYPAAAIAEGIEGRATATCAVETDLTLACTAVEVIIPPRATAFEQAARNALKHFRAGPKLTNGAPAAGTEVRVPVRFRLED